MTELPLVPPCESHPTPAPDWRSGAEKGATFSAQPGAPYVPSGAEKVEKSFSALPSAEGEPDDDELAAGTAEQDAAAPPREGFGRPKVLSTFKKAQVAGLIAAGMSQRSAAAYLGFHPSTISKALRTDRQFAADIARSVVSAKFVPLFNIIQASKKNWRAAAWLYKNAQPTTDLEARDARRAAQRRERQEREARRERQNNFVDDAVASLERFDTARQAQREAENAAIRAKVEAQWEAETGRPVTSRLRQET